jgi:SOS-response transcriptional repressor LexA
MISYIREDVESRLKGNTLRVYVYVLKKGRVGVREVQRSLGFSNPSLAQYHLNKLKELGLVREDGGEYEVVSEVKVDVLRDFLRFGTLLVPRFVMYAMFFTVFTVYLTIVSLQMYSNVPIVYWFTALLTLSTIIFWYESLRAWFSAPST